MILKKLLIKLFPGFSREPLLLEDLSSGINIICAPNGAGKTSTCKALAALLWPGRLKEYDHPSLESLWENNNQTFSLNAEGHTLTAGSDIPLSLPDEHVSESYIITVDDLFSSNSLSKQEIDKKIQSELSGGYNLQAIGNDELMKIFPRKLLNSHKLLQSHYTRTAKIHNEQKELRESIESIKDLKRRLEELSSSSVSVSDITTLEHINSIRKEKSEIQQQLDYLPVETATAAPVMEQQAQELGQDLRKKTETLKKNELMKERLLEELQENPVPEAPEQGEVFNYEELLQKMLRISERLEERKEELVKLQAVLESTECATVPATKIDTETLLLAEKTAGEYSRLQGEKAFLDKRQQLLERQNKKDGSAETHPAVKVLNISFLILSLVVAITAAVTGLWWLLGCIPALTAVPLTLHFRLQAGRSKGSWTETEAERLEVEKDSLKRKEEELEQNKTELAAKFNLDPDIFSASLLDTLKRLEKYQTAYAEIVASKQIISKESAEVRNILNSFNNFSKKYNQPAADSPVAAQKIFQELRRLSEEFREASTEVKRLAKTISALKEETEKINDRYKNLFTEHNLKVNDFEGLKKLILQKQTYSDLADFFKEKDSEEKALLQRLPEELISLLDAPEALIISRKELIEDESQERENIKETITAIQTSASNEEKASRLEEALKGQHLQVEEHKKLLDSSFFAAAGLSLLKNIKNEHKASEAPVLSRSAEYFSKFTNHRYDLIPSQVQNSQTDTSETLLVKDSSEVTPLSLSELSRGTAMQLLLATRLAYAESEEKGEKLPFILDEALSSSDPLRFKAIAEALIQIAESGRQIIYFCCQPSDAAAWEELFKEKGFNNYCIQQKFKNLNEYQPATVKFDTVSHEGLSIDEYRRKIKLSPLPHEAEDLPASLPVGWISDNPELISKCISAGIKTFGQIQSLVAAESFQAYFSIPEYETLSVRAGIMGKAIKESLKGRGKKLNSAVLTEFGGKAGGELIKAAENCKWKSREFIDFIEPKNGPGKVKGFGTSRYENLKKELAERGYYDESPELTEEEVLQRTLSFSNQKVLDQKITTKEIQQILSLVSENLY